jgi:phospholipid-binding lipoprotein MlaA
MEMSIPYSVTRNGKIKSTLSSLIIGMLALSGCASTSNSGQPIAVNKVDPYENINRKIYNFNDKVDNYVAEPISDVYRAITPQFMQTGVFNFFNNLKGINIVVNDVLQGKFSQSARDTGRFAMNSTFGLGGLFDVAKKVGLEQNNEDFDQTLAVWGIPSGKYLVIPLLGPVTTRGIPGAVFDTAANPASYVGAPVQLLSLLNTRANAEGALKFIDEAALDPYVFTRESFLQWRNSLATDGQSQANEEFDEALEEEDGSSSVKENAANINEPFRVKVNSFEQASHSFGHVSEKFDEATKSFEEANNKIGRLKK